MRTVTILDVDVKRRGDLVHVQLRGELDLSTVGQVEEELGRMEDANAAVIALDLRGLTFLDSTGLRVLVTADERARERGRRLLVVRGPDPVHRVFTITKLDERLEMVDDLPTTGGGP